MDGLAELHLHLYGCLSSDRVLDMLARAARPSWERYEGAYERAFGRPSPARSLVARHRAGDPRARGEFAQIFVVAEDDSGSFARFQAKFDLITAASHVGLAVVEEEHVPEAVEEIRSVARAVREDQAREGIAYAEQRFFFGRETPSPLVERGLSAILEEYARPGPVTARLAVSLPRSDPFPHWEIVERLSRGPHGNLLTGIDFCFIEEGHPPKEQRALFDLVHDHNAKSPDRALAILYHVGESFDDKSLESAVRWVHEAAELGAHRLGHAIALGVEPEAYGPHVRREAVCERRDQIAYDLRHAHDLERLSVRVDRAALTREDEVLARRRGDELLDIAYDAERLEQVRARQRFAMRSIRSIGAVVEVCPTSNLRIGGLRDPAHHPVQRFLEEGLSVVVASDDPGIFGTTLANEVAWVAQHARLDRDALAALRERAWQSRSEILSGRERARSPR